MSLIQTLGVPIKLDLSHICTEVPLASPYLIIGCYNWFLGVFYSSSSGALIYQLDYKLTPTRTRSPKLSVILCKRGQLYAYKYQGSAPLWNR